MTRPSRPVVIILSDLGRILMKILRFGLYEKQLHDQCGVSQISTKSLTPYVAKMAIAGISHEDIWDNATLTRVAAFHTGQISISQLEFSPNQIV